MNEGEDSVNQSATWNLYLTVDTIGLRRGRAGSAPSALDSLLATSTAPRAIRVSGDEVKRLVGDGRLSLEPERSQLHTTIPSRGVLVAFSLYDD